MDLALDDEKKPTRRLARVLAPQGRVAFAEPNVPAGEELARALAAAGFEGVEVGQLGGEAVVSGRLR